MSSIWDEGNIIHCAGPPGVPPGIPDGGGAGDESGFVPNCFCGLVTNSENLLAARVPQFTLAGNNCAIEVWLCSKVVDGVDWDAEEETAIGIMTDGLLAGVPSPAAAIEMQPPTPRVRGRTEQGVYGGSNRSSTAVLIPGWHYYCFNVTQGGNIELFLDGVSQGVNAINVANVPILYFLPFIGMNGDPTNWWNWHEDPPDSVFSHVMGRCGPIAYHQGAGAPLTAAEMHDSMAQRYPRNVAETQLIYDWRTVGGVQGWDGDRANIIRGIEEFIEVPIAAPEGVDGTVVVPDMTGNGNDFILRTRAAYDPTISVAARTDWTIPGMSCCALASDPYWQQGGS